jgi:CPA1 family monovalent cation:H+ antiporter
MRPEMAAGVQEVLIVLLALLLVAAAVGFAARRLGVHYNIALVVVGAALTGLHVFPRVGLDPDVVIQVFLPVLLFEAAISTDLRRLRNEMWPVVLLAVPGMLLTVFVAGAILRFGLGLPLTVALLVGAILATTDTIAVIATFRKVRAPARLRTIVENESLFNDGTALVAFATILAALQRGAFDVGSGAVQLAWVSVAGIGIGAVAGWAAAQLIRQTDDHLMEILFTVIVTYGAWVVSERLHASPVLAVVAAGITIGSVGWTELTPTGKVAIRSFWAVAAFGIDTVLFLLIGLQLDLGELGGAAPAIAWGLLALTVGRVAAVYSMLALLRFRHRGSQRVPMRWQHLLVWGNLKGSLSMALALSLPRDLPQRDLITAIVFGCAFVTLTVQGLTLAPLARWFGLGRGSDPERLIDRNQGRLLAARAAQAELDRLQRLGVVPLGTFQRMRAAYQGQIARSERQLRDLVVHTHGEDSAHLAAVRRRLLEIEKGALQDAVGSGMIAEDVAEELVAEVDKELSATVVERS